MAPSPPGNGVFRWLETKRTMRAQGGAVRMVPADSYDVLLFVAEITRTVPTAGAKERLQTLRMD